MQTAYTGLWIGTVDGATSGTISLDLRQTGNLLRGSANLYSPLYGTSAYTVTGTVHSSGNTYLAALAPTKGHPYSDSEILVEGSILPSGQLVGEFKLSGTAVSSVITANREAPAQRKAEPRAVFADGWFFDDELRRYVQREVHEAPRTAQLDWSLIKSVQSRLKSFVDEYLKIFDVNAESQVFFLEAHNLSGIWRVAAPEQQEHYIAYPALAARLHGEQPEGIAPDGSPNADALTVWLNADPVLAASHTVFAVQHENLDSMRLLPLLFIKKDLFSKYFAFADSRGERSFFHAAIGRLHQYLEGLHITEHMPPLPHSIIRHLHEEAARLLLARPAMFAKDPASVTGCLYNTVNTIAALQYEKKDCAASMLFVAGSDMERICRFDSVFKTPVQISETRKVRKLLESSSGGYHLLTDGGLIYGVGRLRPDYTYDNDSVFRLEILGHSKWHIYANRQLILRQENGKLSIDKHVYDTALLHAALSRYLPGLTAVERHNIEAIINTAVRLGHGSMLVFSEAAASEADRLVHEGFMVHPFAATPDNIPLYTAIDGAVLLDTHCACHGFGVILDGMTISDKSKIRSDRGARYNSALRYFEKNADSGAALFIVVTSDDETVDFFPGLA